MITKKIHSLFQFIDFLHSNIDHFTQFENTTNKYQNLREQRNELSPDNNFSDKLKYNDLQAEIKLKFNVIDESIIQPIRSKVYELNICDWNNSIGLRSYTGHINDLKENFTLHDLPTISKHKSKYIQFREETNITDVLHVFFEDLDYTLKILFDFFKDTKESDFETFGTKTIQGKNISETAENLETSKGSALMPFSGLYPNTKQNTIEAEAPQQDQKTKLTLKQIALLYIYNRDHITAENNNEVAKKYGHNSGHKIQQYYNKYLVSTDRKPSEKKRKDKSLMKDIEKIIAHLPEDKKAKPRKEVELLKNAVENNY